MALECRGVRVDSMSAESSMRGPGAPFLLTAPADWSKHPAGAESGVTVILRTRDRPQFLQRAVSSIAAQGLREVTICVVNDGGDPEATERIVRAEAPAGVEVEFIHNAEPVGQVEALNLGFNNVRREFFAIHDDDELVVARLLDQDGAFSAAARKRSLYRRGVPRADYRRGR